MRIGLIGAPGSGKSKLARALAKEYDLKLVDGYVQRLQKKTGLALGPWSSYSELFMVAGHRLAEEEKIGDQDRITAGTMVDTLAYAATHSDIVLHQSDRDVRSAYFAAQGAMQGLGLIYRETWDYDLSFFLPYSDEQQREKPGTWEVALDKAYLPVIESFEVPYAYSVAGDHKERFQIIKDTIDRIQATTDADE